MVDEVVEDGAAAVVLRKGVGSFPIFDFCLMGRPCIQYNHIWEHIISTS